MMNKMAMIALAGAAVALVAMPIRAAEPVKNSPGQAKFEFALIGDVPYNVLPGTDYPPFDNLVADINSDPRIKWVLHAGDIKAGGTRCSDELYLDRFVRYSAFEVPFVITPGDNEWTDCHRIAAGGYQPLERLAKLREVFFANPGQTLGQRPMTVTTQASDAGYEEFPENVLWTKKNVVFATIHVVGSQNGLDPFQNGSPAVRTVADDEEVERRIDAAIAWLNKAFAYAEALDSPGVFLMIHANPRLELNPAGLNREGFTEILAVLEDHIAAYDRPVVLAHGDSHYFRVDKPDLASGNFLRKFTRVETFGTSRVHWVRVSVDTQTREVFTFRQQIVEDNGG